MSTTAHSYSLYPEMDMSDYEFPLARWVFMTTGAHIRFQNTYVDLFYRGDIDSYLEKGDWTLLYRAYDKDGDESVLFANIEERLYLSYSCKFNGDIGHVKICSAKESEEEWLLFVREIVAFKKERPNDPNNIYLITNGPMGLDSTKMSIKKFDMNIGLHYGDAFQRVNEKILTALNEPDGKGLVLLHGLPGTGKTHYLRFLASQITEKKIVFIPPHMSEIITSPQFMPFLISWRNSILFIEDAERVIMSREDGGSQGVSNILNLTDGLLSDMLSIQIVATFNVSVDQIDKALLRKGRLIAEHYFGKLDTESANALLQSLGKEFRSEEPLTLAEIFNVEEEAMLAEKDDYRPVGFERVA